MSISLFQWHLNVFPLGATKLPWVTRRSNDPKLNCPIWDRIAILPCMQHIDVYIWAKSAPYIIQNFQRKQNLNFVIKFCVCDNKMLNVWSFKMIVWLLVSTFVKQIIIVIIILKIIMHFSKAILCSMQFSDSPINS